MDIVSYDGEIYFNFIDIDESSIQKNILRKCHPRTKKTIFSFSLSCLSYNSFNLKCFYLFLEVSTYTAEVIRHLYCYILCKSFLIPSIESNMP